MLLHVMIKNISKSGERKTLTEKQPAPPYEFWLTFLYNLITDPSAWMSNWEYLFSLVYEVSS